MKKHRWKKILIALLAVLIACSCGAGYIFWKLDKTINSAAEQFSAAMENSLQQLPSASASGSETGLFDMYAALYQQLEASGSLKNYGIQSASFANLVLDYSFKPCSVSSILYREDGFEILLEGDVVPLSAYDKQFWQDAAVQAARSYLSHHFLEAASALLQSEDAIRQQLFAGFGVQIFETMEAQLKAMPRQPVRYLLQIKVKNNSWSLQVQEQFVSDDPAAND